MAVLRAGCWRSLPRCFSSRWPRRRRLPIRPIARRSRGWTVSSATVWTAPACRASPWSWCPGTTWFTRAASAMPVTAAAPRRNHRSCSVAVPARFDLEVVHGAGGDAARRRRQARPQRARSPVRARVPACRPGGRRPHHGAPGASADHRDARDRGRPHRQKRGRRHRARGPARAAGHDAGHATRDGVCVRQRQLRPGRADRRAGLRRALRAVRPAPHLHPAGHARQLRRARRRQARRAGHRAPLLVRPGDRHGRPSARHPVRRVSHYPRPSAPASSPPAISSPPLRTWAATSPCTSTTASAPTGSASCPAEDWRPCSPRDARGSWAPGQITPTRATPWAGSSAARGQSPLSSIPAARRTPAP